MEPLEPIETTAASSATEVANNPAGLEPATVLWLCAAALFAFHGVAAWRWWSMRRLRAIPPTMAVIRSIRTVAADNDGGQRRQMAYELTPTTGPDAGKTITGHAWVRAIARYETVVGQKIPVHVHPRIRGRHLVPESGNPWVPALVILAFLDLTVILIYATT